MLSKIAAFFREFPFLAVLLAGREVVEAYVRRVDVALLKREPGGHYYYSTEPDEDCWLVDANGGVIAMVGHRPRYRNPDYQWWGVFSRNSRKWLAEAPTPDAQPVMRPVGKHRWEPLGKTLSSLSVDQRNQVHYVVVYHTIQRIVIVYKTPKNFSLVEWIDKQEWAAVRDAISAIDAEGSDKK